MTSNAIIRSRFQARWQVPFILARHRVSISEEKIAKKIIISLQKCINIQGVFKLKIGCLQISSNKIIQKCKITPKKSSIFLLAALFFLEDQSRAQYLIGAPPQPVVSLDVNSVSLFSGTFSPVEPELKIGSPDKGIAFQRFWTIDGWRHNLIMYVTANYFSEQQSQNLAMVIIGGETHFFSVNTAANGSLYFVTDDGTMLLNGDVWLNKNGDRYTFSESSTMSGFENLPLETTLFISKIEKSTGEVITFNYERFLDTTYPPPIFVSRLSSVVSNYGFEVKFLYREDNYNNVRTDYSRLWRWGDLKSVFLLNLAYENCPLIGNMCAPIQSWPNLNRTLTWTGAIDDGASLKYFVETINQTGSYSRSYNIRLENSSTRNAANITSMTENSLPIRIVNISYTYPSGLSVFGVRPFVASVNDSGTNWVYTFSGATAPQDDVSSIEYSSSPIGFEAVNQISGGIKLVRTSPANVNETFYGTRNGQTLLEIDGLYRKRKFSYISNMGPVKWVVATTNAEGDKDYIVLDNRYNSTSYVKLPKPGSALPSITRSAAYGNSCLNSIACNFPTYTLDSNLKQTDFTYDPIHGGVLSETGPADDRGIRPQTRYAYSQRYAWVLGNNGSYQRASAPVWLKVSESRCQSSAATGNSSSPCTDGDEIRIDYDYGPDSGPNNLFLRGLLITSDGRVERTCFRYDKYGNKISETGPRAGLSACP